MQRIMVAISVALMTSLSAWGMEDLSKAFVSPPASARPWVYWYVLNGNLTKAGITADLEAMARVGIGGVLYLDAKFGAPKGPVQQIAGPQWMDLLAFACQEANRLGLQINIGNSPGWSGSGGPWITPELSMQQLVWTETSVEGGKPFEGVLAQPLVVSNFYRDVAVMAFPTLGGDAESMSQFAPKFSSNGQKSSLGGYVLQQTGSNEAQYVQVEFAQPYTARMMTVKIGPSSALALDGVLETSEDGQKFTPVQKFSGNGSVLIRNLERSVKSRFFRFVFDKAHPGWLTHFHIAEVELSPACRIENIKAKALMGMEEFSEPARADYSEPDAAAVIASDKIIDLSSKMDAHGKLKWNPPSQGYGAAGVPPGRWTLLRFGHTSLGTCNLTAPESALGLETDKFSKQAARVAFDGMLGPLIARNRALAGQDKVLASTHIDSWETGTYGVQNWTANMPREFKRLRGYDLWKYLPVYTGRLVDGLETSERFLWDLRRTSSDLICRNYAGEWRRLASKAGLRLSIEAYGGPANNLDYAAYCDEPMGEFWAWNKYGLGGSCGEMASAARTNGRKIIGAEAFTSEWNEQHQGHPSVLKDLGDWAFCEGINRFNFHTYVAQSWGERAPGMSLGPYGLHYERTQTWWDYSRPWHEYLARCQHLLRQGLYVADVAYLQAEGTHGVKLPPDAKQDWVIRGGYNWDVCSAQVVIDRMRVKDGRIVLPDGMSYRVLALPETETMTLPLVRAIKRLADQGAVIVGSAKPPRKSPSLADRGAGDQEIQQLAGQLWGGGKVVTNKTANALLREQGVPPDFAAPVMLRHIHRTVDGLEFYFVANPQPQEQSAVVSFRVAGRQPELWHPETGRIRELPEFTEENGVAKIPLRFGPSESFFVVFRKGNLTTKDTKSTKGEKNFPELKPVQELTGSWQVAFDPKWGGPAKPVTFETLTDWSSNSVEGIKYYSGTAVYRKVFDADVSRLTSHVSRLYLDLGRVHVMARVTLNGQDLGILWKPPYRVEVTPALKPGANTLEIRVVNLWRNRLIGDEQLPAVGEWAAAYGGTSQELQAWPQWLLENQTNPSGRHTFTTCRVLKKDQPLSESGLLGPVSLLTTKE